MLLALLVNSVRSVSTTFALEKGGGQVGNYGWSSDTRMHLNWPPPVDDRTYKNITKTVKVLVGEGFASSGSAERKVARFEGSAIQAR